MNKKFELQEKQYQFPYHHLIEFGDNHLYIQRDLVWGLDYYSYLSEVIKIIKNLDIKTFIDIGCGDGKLIYEISKRKEIYDKLEKIIGVDLAPKAILFAKAFCYGKKKVEFYNLPIENINEKFDLVTLIEVLEHISDSDLPSFVRSLFRVIKKNGYLLLTVPSKNIPLSSKHYRHYDLNLLKENFREENYEILKILYLHKTNKLIKILSHPLVLKIFNLKLLNNKIIKFGKWFKYLYDSFFKIAKENNCTHILMLARKR